MPHSKQVDPVLFRDDFVKPALEAMHAWSPQAEMLLMGTAAHESLLIFTRQQGGGPALGYFQMETATFNDCWTNYLNFRPELKERVLSTRKAHGTPHAEEMVTDAKFAAAMARVRYLRVPPAIPTVPHQLAIYWKLHYNTPLGAGTVADFIAHWNSILAPTLYPRIE